MPTIIKADRWEFDPDALETGFSPNHGQNLTTESIIASMDDVESRPEMQELDRMLKESPCYLKGKEHG